MILHEIYRLLEQIDRKLDALGAQPESNRQGGSAEKASADEWIQLGLSNILGYEAGKKQEGRE